MEATFPRRGFCQARHEARSGVLVPTQAFQESQRLIACRPVQGLDLPGMGARLTKRVLSDTLGCDVAMCERRSKRLPVGAREART